jgi:quinol monooxygenase YgiN
MAIAADIPAGAPSGAAGCTVYELRQYTLHPGRRDTLITLFEREFVETQEAAGMTIHAQFRDLDDADRFVWIRGFAGMDARRDALGAFYGGPVWQAHRDAANATMIDSDNVLLLRPASGDSGIALDRPRPALDAVDTPHSLVVATIWYGKAPLDAAFDAWFLREMAPVLTDAGGTPIARFVNETAPNTFERLPVREGENAYVWFARYADTAAYDAFRDRLAQSERWQALAPALHERFAKPPQHLRLAPTARSQWR